MKKLAIIGASYLQEPLIRKAKDMGIETHVFAWKVGDVGEYIADYFYPISIIEKDKILKKCKEIGIDGICSIASDLAVITVNYVAENMGLIGNGMESTKLSTNKHLMRNAFEMNGDPSPKSILVDSVDDIPLDFMHFPLIVKPTDRSGSRGITKVYSKEELNSAISHAKLVGFEKKVLVEEFADGDEYSVECISFEGAHTLLAITQKFTTGEPHFVENGHLEPAQIDMQVHEKIKNIVFHALDSLCITYGASHSELKISSEGDIKIIEIGGRMGGDCIGSSLVQLSTGIDFVKQVILISMGETPDLKSKDQKYYAAVRFVMQKDDLKVLDDLKKEDSDLLVEENVLPITSENVLDSSERFGYFLMKSNSLNRLLKYMPKGKQ